MQAMSHLWEALTAHAPMESAPAASEENAQHADQICPSDMGSYEMTELLD